jgi:hypothetical protein
VISPTLMKNCDVWCVGWQIHCCCMWRCVGWDRRRVSL